MYTHTGYRAPKSIDPRLLNPKFVFKEMTAESVAQLKNPNAADAKPDLFLNTVMKAMKKAKPNRQGYGENDLTLFRRVSVLEFLKTPRPIALITECNQFSFDEKLLTGENREQDVRALQIVEAVEETDAEVRSCCEDLKVLARREFKTLVKWRLKAREALIAAKLIEGAEEQKDEKDSGSADDSGEEVESEADIDEELREARSELMAKEKRKRRKAKKLKSALQRKIDMKIILPTEAGPQDEQSNVGLFFLENC